MYRVQGSDGNSYEAPNIATLQLWVEEGRIIATTVVEDLLSGTTGPASGVEGLSFGTEYSDKSNYPRAQEVDPQGCAVHLPLVFAILSTICFSPIGVIAVIFAAKIPLILAAGDKEKAIQYTRIAYRFAAASFLIGILFLYFELKYGRFLGLDAG